MFHCHEALDEFYIQTLVINLLFLTLSKKWTEIVTSKCFAQTWEHAQTWVKWKSEMALDSLSSGENFITWYLFMSYLLLGHKVLSAVGQQLLRGERWAKWWVIMFLCAVMLPEQTQTPTGNKGVDPKLAMMVLLD